VHAGWLNYLCIVLAMHLVFEIFKSP